MNEERDQDYEALLENYEDALMRLIMYRVAQEDGKRLLEEAEELERSGFEVPKELDEKCLKLIRERPVSEVRTLDQEKNEPSEGISRRHFRLRMFGRVLVAAVLAAVLLFSVAYAANDEFRVNVLNFFLEIEENGTFFFFQSKKTGDVDPASPNAAVSEEEFPFEFTYVPEGYELFLQEIRSRDRNGISCHCRYSYFSDDFNNFYFEMNPIVEGTGLFIDTEDAVVTDVNIRGYDGWLIEKTDPISGNDVIMYLLLDLEGNRRFHYSSVGISAEESQKIFDGIVIHE